MKIEGAFPYEEIKDTDGNYFQRYQDVLDAGFSDAQVWTVIVTDEDLGLWITYDNGYRFVNVLGYVASKEEVTAEECYEEWVELDD